MPDDASDPPFRSAGPDQSVLRADDEAERLQRSWGPVTAAVDAIRARYGGSSVGPASLVGADGLRIRRRGEAQWGPSAVHTAGTGMMNDRPPCNMVDGAWSTVRGGRDCGSSWPGQSWVRSVFEWGLREDEMVELPPAVDDRGRGRAVAAL